MISSLYREGAITSGCILWLRRLSLQWRIKGEMLQSGTPEKLLLNMKKFLKILPLLINGKVLKYNHNELIFLPSECTLCGYPELKEKAHVQAFSVWKNDPDCDYTRSNHEHKINNIIDLCPNCHKLFDKGLISIHPGKKVFIFSDLRFIGKGSNFTNPFYWMKRYGGYVYPRDNNSQFSLINRVYFEWNFKEEFKLKFPDMYKLEGDLHKQYLEYGIGCVTTKK